MLQDGGGRLAQLVLGQVGHAGVAGALLGRVGAAGYTVLIQKLPSRLLSGTSGYVLGTD